MVPLKQQKNDGPTAENGRPIACRYVEQEKKYAFLVARKVCVYPLIMVRIILKRW